MASFLSRLFGSAITRRPNQPRNARLEIETLEARIVPTTALSPTSLINSAAVKVALPTAPAPIALNAITKTLTLTGDNGVNIGLVTLDTHNTSSPFDDTVTASINRGSQNFTQKFALYDAKHIAAITKVVFQGLDGNDVFTNKTIINSQSIFGATPAATTPALTGPITLDTSTKTLTLTGDDGINYALVTIDTHNNTDPKDDEIVATITIGSQTVTQRFLRYLDANKTPAVTMIVMFGNAGNDVLTNNTDIKSTIYGGAGNDTIYGGSGDDTLLGEDGNDYIHGGAGNDIIRGGDGDDILFGDTGSDTIYGEIGNDTIYGSADGKNTIYGGDGNDSIYGGNAGDLIYGGTGNDLIYGGDGDDNIYGGDGNDSILGEAGDDILDGGFGNDLLDGGKNDDIVSGGPGNDYCFGGDDSDTVYGNDVLFGGRLVFSATSNSSYNIRGDQGLADGCFDHLYGNNGHDTFEVSDEYVTPIPFYYIWLDSVEDNSSLDTTIEYKISGFGGSGDIPLWGHLYGTDQSQIVTATTSTINAGQVNAKANGIDTANPVVDAAAFGAALSKLNAAPVTVAQAK